MEDHVVGAPSSWLNILTAMELSITPSFVAQSIHDSLFELPEGMLTEVGSDLLGSSATVHHLGSHVK